MLQYRLPFSLLAAAFLLPSGLASPVRAESAPPIEPKSWLNNKTPVSWKSLKGRVILVEKWATW